jgi:hypothetical protein
MQRISGAVLKDIRNIRKHKTYASPGSNDNHNMRESPSPRA